MTNGDKIRSMNDRELTEFLCEAIPPEMCGSQCPWCHICQINPVNLQAWMKQEVKEHAPD